MHWAEMHCQRRLLAHSITRAAALCTRCLPHLPGCCCSLAGRLEDKSSLVRKEALKLLQALMLHNPFGPKLPLDRFDKTLAEHRAMLDQLLPGGAAPAPGAAGDALQQGLDVKPLPAEDAAEAAADAEGDERQQPGQEGSAEGMEVDGEVAQAGQTAADSDEEEQEGQPAPPSRSRECGWVEGGAATCLCGLCCCSVVCEACALSLPCLCCRHGPCLPARPLISVV